MRPKVYIARKVPGEVESYLQRFTDCRKWEGPGIIPRSTLLKELKDAEGLLINGEKIDRELLDAAPNLRVVSNNSVGYNNFDFEAMRERRVIGTNTPGVLDDTVADLVMALILAAARRITELDQFVKSGKWTQIIGDTKFGIDVHHATLGIVGMGRIGEAIAKRARFGFDMEILYHNRTRRVHAEETYGATYASLERLLQESDFVVLMTPLTPETVGLFGGKEFAQMKESAIFINASRGETVDEGALVEALQSGRIRGAGLDVFVQEPIAADNPLLKLPNVVTVPHIGSATAKTRFDMAMLAAENLVKALLGDDVPPNVVPELKDLVLG